MRATPLSLPSPSPAPSSSPSAFLEPAPATPNPARRRALHWLAAVPLVGLAGCATLGNEDPLRVNVVGLEQLPGEGFELRLNVKLRVQNPRSTALDYDGIALELDVNGRALATGVSAEAGSVPRYGERVLTIPVSVSAAAALRQVLGLADKGASLNNLPYAVRGRLGGGLMGGHRFAAEGTLQLSN